jgi:hypothetical protein
MPTKLRGPAGALAGRPTPHMPTSRPVLPAAAHHTDAPLASAMMSSHLPTSAMTSSPSLTSAPAAAAGHYRAAERHAIGGAGGSAAAGRSAGPLAAAARPGYGPAPYRSAAYGSTGRPVTRRPTIAPPAESTPTSFALPSRRVAAAPVSSALGRCCTFAVPSLARTKFVLGRDPRACKSPLALLVRFCCPPKDVSRRC